MGLPQKGSNTISATWDGRNSGGTVVPNAGYTLTLTATNSVGNQTSASAANLVYVDTLAPSVTLAVTPTTSGGFTLGWSGSDATAGVLNYDVQSREGAGGSWVDVLSDTPLLSTSVNGKVGYQYYFRVRAEDRAGNISGWVQVGPYTINRLATKYYLFGSQRVAMRQGNVVYYLHSDHLGSTSLTTDGSGAVVSQARYLPYGEIRWGGTGPTDFGFTGQRNDSFGLMDFNARFYSPYLNRFVSPDTVVPDPTNPQNFNRYAYALNNPLRYTDPTGHDVDCSLGESACKQRVAVEQLWDPNKIKYVENRHASEDAFIHFLNNPDYFANMLLDPHQWATNLEAAYLDSFAEYSLLGTTAGDLILNAIGTKYGIDAINDVNASSIRARAGIQPQTLDDIVSTTHGPAKGLTLVTTVGIIIVFGADGSGYGGGGSEPGNLRPLSNKEVRKFGLHSMKQDLGLPGDADLYVDGNTGKVYYRVNMKGAPYEYVTQIPDLKKR